MRELKDKKWVAIRVDTWLTMNKTLLELAQREKKQMFYMDFLGEAVDYYAKMLAEKWKQEQQTKGAVAKQ
jgi:hypothetical protein